MSISQLLLKILDQEFYYRKKGNEQNIETKIKKLYENIVSNCKNILFLLHFIYYYIKKNSWNETNYKTFHKNLQKKLIKKITKMYEEWWDIYIWVKEKDIKYFEYSDIWISSIFTEEDWKKFIIVNDSSIAKKNIYK